jgi:hypothetical protein
MRCSLTASPEYHLDIPLDLAAAIVLASTSHYDYECRRASSLGGFLWPLRSYFPEDKVHHICVEDRHIQTLMKICENRGALSDSDRPQVQDLLALLVHASVYADQTIKKLTFDVPLPDWAKPE